MKINKYLLIIGVFILGIILASSYFKCRKTVEHPATDSTAIVIAQQNQFIAILQKENDSLKTLRKKDSIHFVILNNNIADLNEQHIIYVNQIKQLTFDETCLLAQENFTDTTKIQKVEIDKNVKAIISEAQLIEVNVAFADVDHLIQVVNSNDTLIAILLNSDNLNSQIISNYVKMLSAKDTINLSLQAKNDLLQNDLVLETKKYKRQRFWKFAYKGAALVELFIIAIK
jgi:hypothetical protein